MNWYSFIFSEKRSYRVARHMMFWLLWWAYFSASFYHYEQSGLKKIEFEPWNFPFLIKSILLLSIHISTCYYFINYLMPKYLFKGKYAALITHIIILGLFIFLSSYFIYKTVLPLINTAFEYKPEIANQPIWWTSITSGLLSAPKIISAAAAIKLIKRWWLKQKEKERLEQEKLITDLQLLKAQIHPGLLFSSLNYISQLTEKKDNNKAAILLLKLADILSYMLYECSGPLVYLDKEIKVIKDYLVLVKTRMGNRLEIDVAIKGETGSKMIAPLLLFSFVENSFSLFGQKKTERNWINLEVLVEFNEITMKMIHGKNTEPAHPSVNGSTIDRAVKWLDFYYPNRYQLKTTIEPEMMMTFLKIELDESVDEPENNIYDPEQMVYATV